MTWTASSVPFRFGDAPVVRSIYKVVIPMKIADTNCTIECEVVDRNIPLLLSKSSPKKAQTIIDLKHDHVSMFGKKLDVFQTTSGHYAIPLKPQDSDVSNEVLTTFTEKLDTSSDASVLKDFKKLPLQFGHVSAEKLLSLIESSNNGAKLSQKLKLSAKKVPEECDACIKFAKPKNRPVVGFSHAKSFTDVVAMHLHQLEHNLWYLHMMDLFSRQSAAGIIRSKEADVIINEYMSKWVSVYGAPKTGVYTDNGGEFNNNNFLEMAGMLNMNVKTAAAYSPWSNGLLEQSNAVLTDILRKIREHVKGISYEVAISWATMAKNSLISVHGFSSH